MLSHYVDTDELSRNAEGLLDVDGSFRHLTGRESRTIEGRNGIVETVTLKDETDDLVQEYRETLELNAPDVSALVAESGIEAGPGTIIVDGDQTIDGRTVTGAVTIARARLTGSEYHTRGFDRGDTDTSRGGSRPRFLPEQCLEMVRQQDGFDDRVLGTSHVRAAMAEWRNKTGIVFKEGPSFWEWIYAAFFGGSVGLYRQWDGASGEGNRRPEARLF